jgi:predicted DNA-binding protein
MSRLLERIRPLVSGYKLHSPPKHIEVYHYTNISTSTEFATSPTAWTGSSESQEHISDISQYEHDEAMSSEDLQRPKDAVEEGSLSERWSDYHPWPQPASSRTPEETVVEDRPELPPSLPVPQTEETTWDHIFSGQYGSYSFDGSSSSSSYARSALSTASLASSATDLSKNSGYSAVQIARATKELILILRDDENLVPLYKRAIDDVVIGPAKLERNLRRFFKAYADHLGDIAGDRLEYLASRLVRLKAKLVARSIVDKYCTEQEALQRQEGNSRQEQEQSSDEENEEHFVDETELHDLTSFRTFLVSSEAFGTLHIQIRSFILPKTAQGGEVEADTENIEKTTECDGIAGEDVEMTTEKLETMTEDMENPTKDTLTTTTDTDIANICAEIERLHTVLDKTLANSSLSLAKYIETTIADIETAQICTALEEIHVVQNRTFANRSLSFAKYIKFAKDFAGATLVAFGYLEPALQPGMTRLRWQCVSASMI